MSPNDSAWFVDLHRKVITLDNSRSGGQLELQIKPCSKQPRSVMKVRGVPDKTYFVRDPLTDPVCESPLMHIIEPIISDLQFIQAKSGHGRVHAMCLRDDRRRKIWMIDVSYTRRLIKIRQPI